MLFGSRQIRRMSFSETGFPAFLNLLLLSTPVSEKDIRRSRAPRTSIIGAMPWERLERSHRFRYKTLNLACLPIPTPGQKSILRGSFGQILRCGTFFRQCRCATSTAPLEKFPRLVFASKLPRKIDFSLGELLWRSLR